MYHFIGIKGSGMSSLAIIMKRLGYCVQGSDYDCHFFTEDGLISNGISIFSFDKDNIKDDMIIVCGNSFGIDNCEVSEAIRRNLVIKTYEEMVSEIVSEYNLVAISGCHGKTTTSSLLAHVIDSNYLIGDGSGGVSSSNYFVLEACEYKRHFLSYNPNYIIITNIDFDHVDYYSDIDDVISAYQAFIDKASCVIACFDDYNVRKLLHDNIFYYGINSECCYQARNVIYSDSGISFDFYVKGNFVYHFSLPFYGKHMVYNVLSILTFCDLNGISFDLVYDRLKSFKGAKRRFSEIKVNDNVIIDDYAHHPNEIKAIIDAVRQKYSDKSLIAIFEPHTFTRTIEFKDDIARELGKADYVYVMDIYKSRENPSDFLGITSDIIVSNLCNGEYLKKDDILSLTKYSNSVLLFMSPNDLTNFEKKLVNEYKNLTNS